MTRKNVRVAVVVLVLAGCGGGPTEGPAEAPRIHPVDQLIAESFGSGDEPGVAFMVVEDGEVVFQRTRGVANVETGEVITPASNFRLASITKQFTALAVLMLADRGALDLDATLVECFPGFPDFGSRITTRMLIYHTSGLVDYEAEMGESDAEPRPLEDGDRQVVDADVLEITKGTDATYFAPGTEWRYSNTGYALLALLVERASGVSFPQFLQQNIFAPLEMTNSLAYAHDEIEVPNRAYGHSRSDEGWIVTDQSPTSAVLGDGGVYTSLEDLKKWFEFLDGSRILAISPQAFETYLTPGSFADGSEIVIAEPPVPSGPRLKLTSHSYGFGWFFGDFEGVPIMHHAGGTMGFRNLLAHDPARRLFVVVLTNRNQADVGFLNESFGYFLKPSEDRIGTTAP